ncbi:aminodeoxychorismate synthase component I [Halobacillus litoralis]|uniref:aminodeoxychorismate synthase component I n=1 Tax=Halobacillus litoralis TaxID=45668 RepID=UPI001CD1DE1A|nr:aminodeoxychorismate synthase component I [Halobacillus litoralis]MCA0971214.1 aminodeoxychorismate synthase component I [Halobacillus litoralis]
MNQEDVKLIFEFADKNGDVRPFAFLRPVHVLTASDTNEVTDAFREIEAWLEDGYYAAGYVSYEAAPAFNENLAVHHQPGWPLLWFGIFEQPFQKETEESSGYDASNWKMKGDFDQYQAGIGRIKAAIERGDTYQVNYTTRLEADFTGDDYSFYRQLVRNQQSSYSAYLQMGDKSLLSASPELFFRIDDGLVTTKPMKGTAKRGRFIEEDQDQVDHLLTSEKEQAENLMIVDLLRNDLGRIAKPGTIRVPKLFEVETYPTVHQMTSTVQGELPESYTFLDVFRALFPCGSITGAPKVRTMEYIKKLESSPRDVYCGAIGFMTPNHEAVFNVPIRTVMIDKAKGRAVYGTGGGVTWDSTSHGEYEEIMTKARFLKESRPEFSLLETMKLKDGAYPLLDFHLRRVQDSALYFQRKCHIEEVKNQLRSIAGENPVGTFKVRMLVDESGTPETEVTPVTDEKESISCKRAAEPVDVENPFLFHKTTHRKVYEQHVDPRVSTVLLWNQKRELTEFTIGNVVVKKDGDYYTPPVSSGLLAGTFRQQLLEDGVIREKVLYIDEWGEFEEIWFINGLRGWLKADFLMEGR